MGERKTAGRPALTRKDLADAALRLLEAEGAKGLSMRRVAAEVGVQAASLYWHVKNKEELLDLASDALWDAVEGADAGKAPEALDAPEAPDGAGSPVRDWRDVLATTARRMRAGLLARPNATRVLVGRFAPGPRALDGMESLLATLREAGFTGPDAADSAYLVNTWVHGFVLQESVPMSASEERGATPAEAAAETRRQLAALPADRYPNVSELAADITGPAMDARFEFGLARLLDGLGSLKSKG